MLIYQTIQINKLKGKIAEIVLTFSLNINQRRFKVHSVWNLEVSFGTEGMNAFIASGQQLQFFSAVEQMVQKNPLSQRERGPEVSLKLHIDTALVKSYSLQSAHGTVVG